jgi:hypothetical protein
MACCGTHQEYTLKECFKQFNNIERLFIELPSPRRDDIPSIWFVQMFRALDDLDRRLEQKRCLIRVPTDIGDIWRWQAPRGHTLKMREV